MVPWAVAVLQCYSTSYGAPSHALVVYRIQSAVQGRTQRSSFTQLEAIARPGLNLLQEEMQKKGYGILSTIK